MILQHPFIGYDPNIKEKNNGDNNKNKNRSKRDLEGANNDKDAEKNLICFLCQGPRESHLMPEDNIKAREKENGEKDIDSHEEGFGLEYNNINLCDETRSKMDKIADAML